MDDETLELLRLLQSGPYDESTWKTVRTLLRTQRRLLRAQQDLSTLTDIVHLLEVWSQACESPRISADVLREAADIAERDVSHAALATDLRKRALARSHDEEPPRATGNPNTLLGKRRSDAGDLDGAIEAYERTLNIEADMEVVYHLAELYAQRGEDGDAQQAADLYCTLGDVLGHPEGLPMLQRAINQVPDHAEALALIAQYAASPGGAKAANQNAGHPRPANQNPAPQSAAPAATRLPSAAPPRARTQTKPGPLVNSPSIAASPRAQPRATAVALTAKAAAPIALDEVDVPIPENTGAMAQPAIANAAPAIQQPASPPTTTIRAGTGKSIRAFPTRTESGLGPAIAVPAPAGADSATASAQHGDPIPISAVAEAPRAAAGAPPLRAAARRAARQFPAPQPAPVITIVKDAAAPSAPSLGPSAPPFQPATSLSPVVVEDAAGVERARTRLNAARARKRKVVTATLAIAGVAALGLLTVAPRNMQEAQEMAKRMFGGTPNQPATSSASRPATETSRPMAASDQPPARVETAKLATPPATTPPDTAAPAPAPAPAVIPSPPTKPATSLATTSRVRPLLDLAKLRGGKLADAQLSAAFDKAAPQLDACYADALAKKPRLKGRLNVAWTIRLNGRATAVKKRGGTINDPELTRCTLDTIAVTRFPKPRQQPAQVRLPLEYRKQ